MRQFLRIFNIFAILHRYFFFEDNGIRDIQESKFSDDNFLKFNLDSQVSY